MCAYEGVCTLVYACWPLCVSCYGLHKYRGHKGNPLPTTAQLLARSHTTPEAYGIGFTTRAEEEEGEISMGHPVLYCVYSNVHLFLTTLSYFSHFSIMTLFSSRTCGDKTAKRGLWAALHKPGY